MTTGGGAQERPSAYPSSLHCLLTSPYFHTQQHTPRRWSNRGLGSLWLHRVLSLGGGHLTLFCVVGRQPSSMKGIGWEEEETAHLFCACWSWEEEHSLLYLATLCNFYFPKTCTCLTLCLMPTLTLHFTWLHAVSEL